ncbi:hypothetical protein TWF225_009020 [Orbilia oligospora]|nr:hypothetical protein TWF751_006224 [Orbilia oligospora]KAF3175122.1 hypothetical protein TWF225_009020 [Orbilia oligospora]KAF3248681.1 hypothetical protein TWF217_009040 [Orbilia oligospora]KAF3281738.1 hypothetical protein TWF132_011153 [Orbilia oligospora]
MRGHVFFASENHEVRKRNVALHRANTMHSRAESETPGKHFAIGAQTICKEANERSTDILETRMGVRTNLLVTARMSLGSRVAHVILGDPIPKSFTSWKCVVTPMLLHKLLV